jgi:L-alanine-DL-glutamate epimerase-like enolase superfamily enzyme
MKVTDVEVIQLAKTLPHDMRNARSGGRRRTVTLALVRTDEGITGLGEAFGNPHTCEAAIMGRLRPLLIGRDPFDVEGFWQKAYEGNAQWDLKGAYLSGLSAIDLACWDIMGKALGQPCSRLLGGRERDWIPAYASDLHWDADTEAMARKAASFADAGYRYVKTHLGVEPRNDVERVRAIRQAIGPSIGLMVDINTAFNRPQAIEFGRWIAEFDIYWYEEPLSPLDIGGFKVVRDSTGLTIATGENEYTRWGFKQLFDAGGVDHAMPDIARTGGFTEMKKIAAVCDAYGVACTPHNYCGGVSDAATLHFMASTPSTTLLEWDTANASIHAELFVEPPEVKDGLVRVPDLPGLGVELRPEVRAEFGVR